MKKILVLLLSLAVLAGGTANLACAGTSPGEVELGKFSDLSKGNKYVEINVRGTLLALAARLVDKQQPEAAKLLRSVQLVRVYVVGLTEDNRGETEKRISGITAQLEKSGWDRVVTVQEKDNANVGVFVKARGEESLEGVVVTVLDGNKQEAVVVNVVGDIKPEQLAALGEAMNIEPLKKAGGSIKK